jgi:hypothetical protein
MSLLSQVFFLISFFVSLFAGFKNEHTVLSTKMQQLSNFLGSYPIFFMYIIVFTDFVFNQVFAFLFRPIYFGWLYPIWLLPNTVPYIGSKTLQAYQAMFAEKP